MSKKTCVAMDSFDVKLVDGVKKDEDGLVYLNSKTNGWDSIKAFYAANPHLLTPTDLRRKGLSCSGVRFRASWWSNLNGCWFNRYDERECHPLTEGEIEAERAHRRELRARAKRGKAAVEARERLADDLHTAFQWVAMGRVPRADAAWVRGDPDLYKSYDYFYCNRSATDLDADRARELLETGPREYDRLPDGRPYDGHPWW